MKCVGITSDKGGQPLLPYAFIEHWPFLRTVRAGSLLTQLCCSVYSHASVYALESTALSRAAHKYTYYNVCLYSHLWYVHEIGIRQCRLVCASENKYYANLINLILATVKSTISGDRRAVQCNKYTLLAPLTLSPRVPSFSPQWIYLSNTRPRCVCR